METDGGVWIHRQRGKLWWTRSSGAEPEREAIADPKPRKGDATGRVVLYHKQCTADPTATQWGGRYDGTRCTRAPRSSGSPRAPSSASATTTRYTPWRCSGREGLSPWHGRADWKAEQERAKKSPVIYADARMKTIIRMAITVIETAKQSDAAVMTARKDKEVCFPTQLTLKNDIAALMDVQEGLCGLTALEMQLEGGDDLALCYSLDRIGSDGRYQAGNLHLVCKSANARKGATANGEIRRLVEMIHASEA